MVAEETSELSSIIKELCANTVNVKIHNYVA